MLSKDEAVLLLSFASAVTGQPVTAEAVTFSPLTQPILFWSLSTAPLMIPFVPFNRFIRGTVGPLFINVALMMVCRLHSGPRPLHVSRRVAHRPCQGSLWGRHLSVLMVISLTLSAVVAWFGLLWIARVIAACS